MSVQFLRPDELRSVIRQHGFSVKALARYVGLDVRSLQRRFRQQLRTTPKAWIIRERMSIAPQLLAAGHSNKEVAASLSYTCESNFCRDFKRHFGSAPQNFTRISQAEPLVSRFDSESSCFDTAGELLQRSASAFSHHASQLPASISGPCCLAGNSAM